MTGARLTAVAGAARHVGASRGGEGGLSPRVQVAEMQRTRLLASAVAVVEELGYTRTTISHITSRARVSRRTFYEIFENREECLIAVLEDAVERLSTELAAADLDGLPWRERVREGLWRILCFCDREPALARVCIVQSSRGSQRVLERRGELLTRLAVWIDEGRHESSRSRESRPLTAEGLVGAAHSILYARLLKRDQVPLQDLLGELMGMIVLPYLGAAAARRERMRPAPAPPSGSRGVTQTAGRPAVEIPMRLTYRTARVLEGAAEHPGISNRALAAYAGIVDQGQASRLLARLQRLGLLMNTGVGHTMGEANAWQLTPMGHEVNAAIHSSGCYPPEAG